MIEVPQTHETMTPIIVTIVTVILYVWAFSSDTLSPWIVAGGLHAVLGILAHVLFCWKWSEVNKCWLGFISKTMLGGLAFIVFFLAISERSEDRHTSQNTT